MGDDSIGRTFVDRCASESSVQDGASEIAGADKHDVSESVIRVDKLNETFTFIYFPLCGLMHASQASQALSNLVRVIRGNNMESFP